MRFLRRVWWLNKVTTWGYDQPKPGYKMQFGKLSSSLYLRFFETAMEAAERKAAQQVFSGSLDSPIIYSSAQSPSRH
jgi:hypothetical protein